MASTTEPPRSRPSTRRRGCRIVTTCISARLLLANQLRALDDVDWTVVSGDPYDDAPPGLRVLVVPMRREFAPSDLRAFARLLATLRRERFDFVQTHTPKASFLGLPAARLARTTAIYTVHGALFFRGNGRLANVAGWAFERWCCAWAHQVLVQSREDADVLPAVGICRRSKLGYVGNGIVLDRFLETAPPADLGTGPIVVMVSRLVREKGCADFLALARALAGRARFVHVGPAEHDQRDALSDAELDDARTSGTVHFVGEVADVRPYLAAATLVVLPSYREGIPRAAMEAAASGRAVAAYDVRGVREVIDPATGLLVARGDLAALTALVGSLLDRPDETAELGRRCRQWVVDRFSEQLVIDRLRDVYAGVRARSARR